jgi:peptide/nickel transport system substrate-binding protein
MTADDVVGSLERVANGQTVWRAQVGPIKTVRKVDDSTVEVDLSQPYTPFLAALAHIDAAIMPMKEFDAKTFDPAKQMLGTGPYEVVNHRQDVSWTFARNPDYWEKGKPSFDKVDVKIVTSDATRAADLRSGAADAVELSSNDDPANLAGAPNVRVATQSTPNFYYLILNSQRPGSKLSDQRVREALNIALDRKQLVDVAMGGLGSPTGIVPAGLPGACDTSQLPSASKTIDDAKQLLADAGASNLSFALTIFNEDPQETQIAQVLQQQLQKLGITVKINAVDPGSFTKAFNAAPSDFDAALSYFAGYADPGMVIRWWNTKLAVFSASFKANDPTMDSLIEQVQSQQGSARATSIKNLCDRADHDAEMIPLVTAPSIIGYRTDVLSPTIYSNEGYGQPWRDIADYRKIGK